MDARLTGTREFSVSEVAPMRADWRRQMSLFKRRFPLFCAVAAAGLSLTAVAVFVLPLRYVARAELAIDPHRQPLLDLRQASADPPTDTAAVDTEVELLKSRTLAGSVVDALGLDRDPELNTALEPPPWAVFGRSRGRDAYTREAVIDQVERRLKIARAGFTYIIEVSFRSRSPDQAAVVANAFTSLYLQQQLDAKSTASRRASDLLNGRLGGLRAEVNAAEHEVESYKAAHGLMTLTGLQGETATEQEISNLDAQLAASSGGRAEAEAKLSAAVAQTAGGGPGDDLGEVLNSPVVQELRKQRDEVSKQIAELQGRYGPLHPELLKAQRQRAELDVQIKQEIARVISNLRVQVQVARGHNTAIVSAVTHAKAELARNNNASVELKRLEQNLDAVRTLYQSFLDRFKQTLAQDGMAQADARLVSPAKPPLSPAWPNRWLLAVAGLMVSMLTGLLTIWVVEAREDGLYAPEDVEGRLGLACLGLLPLMGKPSDLEAGPVDLVLSQPLSGFAEAFRTLKSALLLTRASGPIRTIAIASALPGEGKTTTCMCLGRIMARTGSPTVVVDCDLRRRAMSRLLSAPLRVGLLEVVSGAVDLDEALVLDEASGLWLLPLGDETLAEDDVLDCPAMTRLLETLRRRFRVVLLDTAPVLMVAETALLASQADAALFLTRWGKTSAEAATSAVKRLESAGVYVAGAALTQVDLRRVSSGAYPYGADYYPFYRPAPTQGRTVFKLNRLRSGRRP